MYLLVDAAAAQRTWILFGDCSDYLGVLNSSSPMCIRNMALLSVMLMVACVCLLRAHECNLESRIEGASLPSCCLPPPSRVGNPRIGEGWAATAPAASVGFESPRDIALI